MNFGFLPSDIKPKFSVECKNFDLKKFWYCKWRFSIFTDCRTCRTIVLEEYSGVPGTAPQTKYYEVGLQGAVLQGEVKDLL